ncbi:hypothetical protein NK6_5630 [Bradyrhizobium diazoefficiens]|uniref:Uncharacterized protein n=1 Tax=Bradyrhizobium diazoefficiens TaxID=1355477 RepID=A0A0E4BSD2_9BRAD|nr:hypothetical protein NK6_5630 [Bradyrhizobium diazoefficiens]
MSIRNGLSGRVIDHLSGLASRRRCETMTYGSLAAFG